MPSPARRPDIAVIGAGLMGGWHAATARRLGAKVVAVVDADPLRAQALAERHGAAALPDLGSLLSRFHPTVAHVCTPLPSHEHACEQLLAAGSHVLCEKPLAGTSAQVGRLLQLAEEQGRQLCPVHQFAVQRGVEQVVQRLARLAPIRQILLSICSAGADGAAGPGRDEMLLDVLPHPLSVIQRWLPHVALADARWHVTHASAGELQVCAEIGGVPVTLLISFSARPTEASALVRGAGGTARIDFFHGFASFSGGAVSRAHKIVQPFGESLAHGTAAAVNLARRTVRWEPAYPGLRELTQRFYLSVAGRAPPPFPPATVLDAYRGRDAIAAVVRGRP